MFYQFMYTIENLLSKMYIEGALTSKSRSIALTLAMLTLALLTIATPRSDSQVGHASKMQLQNL